MITVTLRGGLGNQMFQYAAGLNLVLQKKTDLLLDTTFLNDRFPRRGFTYREYDLDVFEIDPKFTALSKISSALPLPGVWLGIDLALMQTKKLFGSENNPTLWGFYQSEKYFAENKDAVRAAFRFRYPLEGEAANIAEKIRQTNAVSIHVRRGDYVQQNNAKLFGAIEVSYYERAVAYVAERTTDPHLFIFSDDPAWCRQNIKLPFPTVYLDATTAGVKNNFHLQLMSICRHNVIANSSFSWWGAWLNQNPGKIVVAPAQWHSDPAINKEIAPENWIRLS